MKQKILFWTILGVSVLVVVLILLAPQSRRETPKTPRESVKPTVTKQDVPANRLPEQFPGEIPLEEGAKILQNYNAKTADSRLQATRVFETSQSLEANYDFYTKFFKDNGWMILTTLNQPKLKVLSAKKDHTTVQVTISENAVAKTKVVEISVTTSQ